jgi:hypothetical protein
MSAVLAEGTPRRNNRKDRVTCPVAPEMALAHGP